MLEVASGAWLAGMGLSPTIGGVVITLLPLGFALVPACTLIGACRWAADASAVARRGEAVVVAIVAALAFATASAVVASLSRSLAVSGLRAAVTTGVPALLIALIVVMKRAGLIDIRRLPRLVRDSAAAAGVALAALVAVSSLLLGISVITRFDVITAVFVELDAGWSGAVLLVALSLGYLPVALIWSMAYVLGPGFAVAVGTSLSPFAETSTATLPGFPLLAALPQEPPPGAVMLPVLAVAAGALGGMLMRRRGLTGLHGAGGAAIVSVFTGVVMAGLAWLASGSLGTTSLATMGPDPVRVGIVGAVLIGIGTLVVVALPARTPHD